MKSVPLVIQTWLCQLRTNLISEIQNKYSHLKIFHCKNNKVPEHRLLFQTPENNSKFNTIAALIIRKDSGQRKSHECAGAWERGVKHRGQGCCTIGEVRNSQPLLLTGGRAAELRQKTGYLIFPRNLLRMSTIAYTSTKVITQFS